MYLVIESDFISYFKPSQTAFTTAFVVRHARALLSQTFFASNVLTTFHCTQNSGIIFPWWCPSPKRFIWYTHSEQIKELIKKNESFPTCSRSLTTLVYIWIFLLHQGVTLSLTLSACPVLRWTQHHLSLFGSWWQCSSLADLPKTI